MLVVGEEIYSSCRFPRCKFPCFLNYHVPFWSGLPLSSLFPSPLCTRANLRFHPWNPQVCKPRASYICIINMIISYISVFKEHQVKLTIYVDERFKSRNNLCVFFFFAAIMFKHINPIITY